MNKLKIIIKKSGMKMNYIAKELGITTQSLNNKLASRTRFTINEARELIKVLNLNDKEAKEIFFE